MFHLNEKKMIRILKEEYTKRIKSFINEKMMVSYGKGPDKKSLIASADQLKVTHDDSRLEYTFVKITDDGKSVILLLPDESRLNFDTPSTSLISDADGFDELYLKNNETENSNIDSSYENKNYIVVPMDEFINNYSLS
jgi:hypothetical protein